jgi:hypothetical protein
MSSNLLGHRRQPILFRAAFTAVGSRGHGFLVHRKRKRLGIDRFQLCANRHGEDDRIAGHTLHAVVDRLHDDLRSLPRQHAHYDSDGFR